MIRHLFLLTVLVSFVNCKKDKPVPQTSEKAKWLTSQIWKYADIIKNNEPFLKNCDLDDRFYYYEDGTYKGDNGSNLCDPNINTVLEGTWQLLENDTKLYLTYKVYANYSVRPTANIEIINPDTLKVNVDLPNLTGSDNYIITYIHQ
ncbi:MAG: hypothetical protein IPQ18_11985 [Saprospiraceae bacterium]|jgi:hypothetical protein|nr:hypothetical protein [Saprospiraceae bacterium]MBL0292797.1 hypothetical protein [Saprospiraceae bacterium]